jgi:NAD(P)-dependent dehydrogenase (short-subunit alcohol dehydrogenase family)
LVVAEQAASVRKEPDMLVQNKVAVIYGAGGAIGGAVARALVREGATVHLTGHALAAVEAVAKEIGAAAEAAEVDALDGAAVAEHLQTVMAQSGRVDISFNAVGFPDARSAGVPLAELDVDQFTQPVTAYARSYFLTAQHAARHMVPAGSGVIMTVSALPGRAGTRLNGGYGAAQAAKDQLTRDLSFELAPSGIRVVGLRPHGLPETDTIRASHEAKSSSTGMSWEQFQAYLAGMSHSRRTMTLDEVANAAVFLASDWASGLTGTTVNLTMGGLAD